MAKTAFEAPVMYPCLSYNDAPAAIEWLARAFGFVKRAMYPGPDGTVAHLTGAGLPSYGVARIGPVYTPKEFRGRGIASYVVGELTRRGLQAGQRMCLFTDQANPTSNKIYAGLGYEPVVEMAEHVVRR